MTDYKKLCAELTEQLHQYAEVFPEHNMNALVERARAALAEPEPEGPTDEEIMELMPQQMRDDLAAAARAMSGFDPDNIKAASVFRIILNRHVADHARAVLARWGRPVPQPSADGEVAELVRKLREQAAAYSAYPGHSPLIEEWAQCFTRAADLLERLSPPQPVPVSERWPGAEDCDAKGKCWMLGKVESDWRLISTINSGVPQLKYCFSHWLPHYALPVPASSSEENLDA